jgi:hypothetical protein
MTPANALLQRGAPTTKKELFARMREIIALGWQKMPAEARYNGTAALYADAAKVRASNHLPPLDCHG